MKEEQKRTIYTFLICCFGYMIRLIGITRPLLGNFATKSIVYAMIAKNFLLNPSTILYPTLDVIVNGEPSLHMTEWPFFSYMAALARKALPFISIDVLGRLLSVTLFVLSGYLLYRFALLITDYKKAFIGLLFYLFFPVGIIYSQSFQLESLMLFLIALLFLNTGYYVWVRRDIRNLIFIGLSLSLLVLIKIQMGILILPITYIYISSKKASSFSKGLLFYFTIVLAFVPPLLWYLHTVYTAQSYNNLFFSVVKSIEIRTFPDPRVFTLDFYLVVFKTAVIWAFSPVGSLFLIMGLIRLFAEKKDNLKLLLLWLLSVAFTFIVLPRKAYEMNYYYVPLLPPASIICAYGFSFIKKRIFSLLLIMLFMVTSFIIAFNASFKTPESEVSIVPVAKAVDRQIEKNAKVVVSAKGHDIALLYYTKRRGWSLPISEDSIDNLINFIHQGADYYVSDNPNYLKENRRGFYKYLKDNYQVIQEDDFILVRLKK